MYCGNTCDDDDACYLTTDDDGRSRLLHASCKRSLAAEMADLEAQAATDLDRSRAQIDDTYRGTPSGRSSSDYRKL